MTKEVGHDEHMYCTAGYLTAQGKVIYRDFSYVAQLPYHPLILALLYRITGTSYYLLVGRFFSVVCEIGIVVCIAGISRSILKQFGRWAAGFAIGAALIYAMNPFVIYACGYAWNHSAVILCVLICLWLFAKMDPDKMNFRRLCVIGALLTFAMFMRPTTAVVYAVFAVVIMFMAPGRLRKGKATALPFVVGTLVLAVWPLIAIYKAPEAFFLNVVRIPALNAAFLRQVGWVHDKAQLTKAALFDPAYIGLIIPGIFLWVTNFVGSRVSLKSDNLKGLFFVVVAVAFVVIVFIPPTMWIQYWAAPVAFIAVALVYPLNHLCQVVEEDTRMRRYLVTAAILVAIAAGASLYRGLPTAVANVVNMLDADAWVPIRVHKISKDIRQKAAVRGPALTLSPLYAIEGGSEIYLEFSAGPFVYRIADKLSDSQRRIVHGAGAAELKELVESRPPSVVILGTEPKLLEEPILEQVIGADWQREVYGENGPVVYFRKSPGTQ
jgi:4-amino-4-deoxy-L-arabinose transferase-like glycosyltransferase